MNAASLHFLFTALTPRLRELADAEVGGDLTPHERAHRNCEASWVCKGCERQVCPRCEVSPGEPDLCRDCWWTSDPEDAA